MVNLKQCHQGIQMESDMLLNVGVRGKTFKGSVSFTHFHAIIEPHLFASQFFSPDPMLTCVYTLRNMYIFQVKKRNMDLASLTYLGLVDTKRKRSVTRHLSLLILSSVDETLISFLVTFNTAVLQGRRGGSSKQEEKNGSGSTRISHGPVRG